METTGDWTRPQCLAGSVTLDGSQPGRHSVKQVRPWTWAKRTGLESRWLSEHWSPSCKQAEVQRPGCLRKKERRRQQRAPFKRCRQISTSAPRSRGDLWPQGSGLFCGLLDRSRQRTQFGRRECRTLSMLFQLFQWHSDFLLYNLKKPWQRDSRIDECHSKMLY